MIRPTTRIRRQHRRGIVLIVVMVVVALMALAGHRFVESVSSDHRAARMSADQLQAAKLVDSGQEFLAAWLRLPRQIRLQERVAEASELFRQTVYRSDGTEEYPVGQFELLPAHTQSRGLEPGDRTVQKLISNESAKLHLATVLRWEHEQPGAGREALLQLPSMTEAIADAILDWIDEDSDSRPYGAEAEYYMGLPHPYGPRNGIPPNLDELLNVQGVSQQQLYGWQGASEAQTALGPTDIERNRLPNVATQGAGSTNRSSSNGRSASAYAASETLGWAAYLTVFSAERNESADGRRRVNVNHADLTVLYRELQRRMTIERAGYVIAYRQYGPGQTSDETPPRQPHTVDLSVPARFVISSVLDLFDSTVVVTGTDGDLILSSPFTTQGGGDVNVIFQDIDQLTLDERERIEGRVNIFEAPEEVLRAIPNIDVEMVQRILALRDGASGDADLGWLLSALGSEVQKLSPIFSEITMGGEVVGVEMLAKVEASPVRQRRKMVLDAAGNATRRVYFQEIW